MVLTEISTLRLCYKPTHVEWVLTHCVTSTGHSPDCGPALRRNLTTCTTDANGVYTI